MKFILVVAYYLVNPGEATDINIKIFPRTFGNVEECQFFKDDLVAQAKISGNRHFYDAKCYGVDK